MNKPSIKSATRKALTSVPRQSEYLSDLELECLTQTVICNDGDAEECTKALMLLFDEIERAQHDHQQIEDIACVVKRTAFIYSPLGEEAVDGLIQKLRVA